MPRPGHPRSEPGSRPPLQWPSLELPITPPYPPMEAKLVEAIPAGQGWLFEPKWDGFRCLAFRDGETVVLQSKAGQPLTRYFPEVAAAVRKLAPHRFVLDGEIAVPVDGKFAFDALLQRIHPSDSRVRKLAAETPAIFLVFDLLVDPDGRALVNESLGDRRSKLEAFAARHLTESGDVRLSPATTDRSVVDGWFDNMAGLGLDGVMAKRLDAAYASGERTAMQKIKRMRTADCVVGGFRWASGQRVVGSLLLGLYDQEGLLHHVGFTSTFKATEKAAVLAQVEPLMRGEGFSGNAPGGPSRWSTERTGEWEPLAPALVCEVRYDHWSGDRFRHGTTFLRWRPDKAPRQCTFDQIPGRARARKHAS